MLKMASCCLIYLTLVKTNQINGRDPVQNLPELPNFMQYYTWCQACGRHADDICCPPVKSCLKSCSCVVCTSSACRLHEISTPKIFLVKEQNSSANKAIFSLKKCFTFGQHFSPTKLPLNTIAFCKKHCVISRNRVS